MTIDAWRVKRLKKSSKAGSSGSVDNGSGSEREPGVIEESLEALMSDGLATVDGVGGGDGGEDDEERGEAGDGGEEFISRTATSGGDSSNGSSTQFVGEGGHFGTAGVGVPV